MNKSKGLLNILEWIKIGNDNNRFQRMPNNTDRFQIFTKIHQDTNTVLHNSIVSLIMSNDDNTRLIVKWEDRSSRFDVTNTINLGNNYIKVGTFLLLKNKWYSQIYKFDKDDGGIDSKIADLLKRIYDKKYWDNFLGNLL